MVKKAQKSTSWHPFTQMKEYCEGERVIIERAEGCHIIDTDGKRYLDGNAAIWTQVQCYDDPDMRAAIMGQLGQFANASYLGLGHEPAERFMEALMEVVPQNLAHCYFSNNGATAIETALKQSFQYWQLVGRPQKEDVVRRVGGFHGNSFGAMSAAPLNPFNERFERWMFPGYTFESIEDLQAILENDGERIACLVIEAGMQGPGGFNIIEDAFLREVAQLCRAHEVHLVVDEVFSGMCRLGEICVSESAGIEPDFLCLGKGLGGGFHPIAATLTTAAVYDAFYEDFEKGTTFYHGFSMSPTGLGAAVGLANLKKLKTWVESGKIAKSIGAFSAAVEANFAGHEAVEVVKHRGLACALKLRREPGFEYRFVHRICQEAMKRGVLVRPLGEHITLVPVIAMEAEELQYLCEQTRLAIEHYYEKHGAE